MASADGAGLGALLREICAHVRCDDSKEPVYSEVWEALNFLCPESLAGATEILDEKVVTKVVARESRREYFLVDGSRRNESHTCVRGFCTCLAYCHNVASRPDALVCKHELAVMLAEALGKSGHRELDDAEWAAQFSHAVRAHVPNPVRRTAARLPSAHDRSSHHLREQMTMPMMAYDHALAASAAPPRPQPAAAPRLL